MNFKYRVVSIIARGALLASASAWGAVAAPSPAGAAPAAMSAAATPAAVAPAAPTSTPTAATPTAAAPPPAAAGGASPTPAAASGAAAPATDTAPAGAAPADFQTLDQEVQGLKKDVIDLNKDLFVLEEELLFPANTQVALYVSMDVGAFFALDSVTVKIDNKEVKNYLYTAREADALLKGGVQQIYLGNLKVGKHELVAFFTGKGPQDRDYKRGATITFDKGVGAKYLELKITDRVAKHQPEFLIKDWD
jgi:hypothetical protein